MGRPIEKAELATLIPHKGRMFLIDRILDYDTSAWTVSSETKLSAGNLFYDDALDGVPAFVLFEFVAQTVSALTGVITRENHLPVHAGFILSVSGFSFDVPAVKAGVAVVVHAARTGEAGSVYSFDARLEADGKLVGSGKLTVMEQKDAVEDASRE